MTAEDRVGQLRVRVRAMLSAAWREPGFCVPNPTTYPHQWLWDSCFHAIVWAALDDERCTLELSNALANQDPNSGFVPHMTYWTEPEAGASYWGRSRTSSITQPPMYGHAAAELVRRGFEVPDEVFERCRRGLEHLLGDRPRTPGGLVPIFHPWETGCDDSVRWTDWATDSWAGASGAGDEVATWRAHGRASWREDKTTMVNALQFDPLNTSEGGGGPIGSSRFAVGSIGFNALIAWNVRELASVGFSQDLMPAADALVQAISNRWKASSGSWIDDPVTETTWWQSGGAGGTHAFTEGSAPGHERPTLDAMLACLVDPRPEALVALTDPSAFGSPFGPMGARADETSLDPDTYWRGPAWPQLSYLIWRAVAGAGAEHVDDARALGHQLTHGAAVSGLAEFWNPSTGAGLGAQPQTWAGLGILPLKS